MFGKLIAAIFITLSLAGCATGPVALNKAAYANIESVNGVLVIPQSNIKVTVVATNPGNTGLVGALIAAGIDSARQTSAEEEFAPVVAELQDYDFRATLQQAVNTTFASAESIRFITPFKLATEGSESMARSSYAEATESAVLFVAIDYQLQSGTLIVDARAAMFPKSPMLRQYQSKPDLNNPIADGNAIYRKTFSFTKPAITVANAEESLGEAAASIATQIANDLKAPPQ